MVKAARTSLEFDPSLATLKSLVPRETLEERKATVLEKREEPEEWDDINWDFTGVVDQNFGRNRVVKAGNGAKLFRGRDFGTGRSRVKFGGSDFEI